MAFLPINELVELSIKHLGSGTASGIQFLERVAGNSDRLLL